MIWLDLMVIQWDLVWFNGDFMGFNVVKWVYVQYMA